MRVNPAEQRRRLLVVTAILEKATAEGRPVRAREVEAVIGCSYPTAKKLMEASAAILEVKLATRAKKADREGSKRGGARRKGTRTSRNMNAPPPGVAAAAIEVLAEELRDRADRERPADGAGGPAKPPPSSWWEPGYEPLDGPAVAKKAIAELRWAMRAIESDIATVRRWVYGPQSGDEAGPCEGCGVGVTRNIPPRPAGLFVPQGTPADLNAMRRVRASMAATLAKLTKMLPRLEYTFATERSRQVAAVDNVYEAVRGTCPEAYEAFAERVVDEMDRLDRMWKGLPVD
jgi:hypothetical protein